MRGRAGAGRSAAVRIGLGVLLPALLVIAVAAGVRLLPDHHACRPGPLLVPTCGVVWGIATDPNTNAGLATAESRLGQRFPLVYRFHDLDDEIPTADERALVRQGRELHISIDARIYQRPAEHVTWRDVAAGRFDAALTRQARGIASLRAPVWVTFDHEPDQAARAKHGSPADYVAAWRHVHALFARAGATNAVWAWIVTGYPPAFATLPRFWPGNGEVDWIGWEAYNSSGCLSGGVDPGAYRNFADSALPFLHWLDTSGRAAGIGTGKPLMIGESGTVADPSDPSRAAGWYRAIGPVLAAHPRIRAITLWDRPGPAGCRYAFDTRPGAAAAIAAARRITAPSPP